MSTTPTAEPEEAIETALVSALSSVTIPVEGVLAPSASGTVKRLSSDTFVSVSVDQSSQDGDYSAPSVPHTFTASVVVHYALADDADGSSFRDECRRVRASLRALTGDGCVSLSAASVFACDEFLLDSTSTSFEGGENPTNTKTYTATVKGRIINTEA